MTTNFSLEKHGNVLGLETGDNIRLCSDNLEYMVSVTDRKVSVALLPFHGTSQLRPLEPAEMFTITSRVGTHTRTSDNRGGLDLNDLDDQVLTAY